MPSRLNPDAIRAKMKEAGIPTLASLSNKSGVSQATIDRIMHRRCGNCNSQTVRLLADALKCSPFDLYNEEALTEGTTLAAAVAVADVVADAVNEAVTAVVNEVVPGVDPKEVASAVPPIQVPLPRAVDPGEYLEYIKKTHAETIRQYRHHIIALYAVIGVLAAVLVLLLAK